MALATYEDLLDAIPKWVNKRTLDGRTADFIALAEADIEAKLRTREMQTTVEAPVTCPSVNLPPDWLDATRLWLGGGLRALDFATPDTLIEIRAGCPGGGMPTHYGLTDTVIELAPEPTTEMSLWMTYYARIPKLDTEHPTNWLTARDMGVYLFGSLIQASAYLLDDARIKVWQDQYAARLAQLNMTSQVALHSGAPLKIRVRGYGSSPSRRRVYV